MSKKQTQTKLPDLEKSLTEINKLIEKMEQGELSLEQSLTHFERGITLVKHCQTILETAEQKVQTLIQNQQQGKLADFDLADEDEDENQ